MVLTASCVQPVVKGELDAMKEASDAPDLKKCTIQVVRRQLASWWENETLQMKEEVTSLVREMKDKREKDMSDCKILSKDLVMSQLMKILLTFFSELHNSTGWAFSILLGGPDPANGRKLDISSLHIGTTALGNWFNQACPKFEERVMEFTPRDTLLTNPSQEAVPAYNFFQDLPPNPQDNDEDCDLDRTILPMPLNYQPPA
ncbi:hypothetical protein BDR04DRAFT_1158857 [Suillus decipiens]|nr:hypothetical protein BDR04DRAFT_1158857 [Suillus decipiens]